MSKQFHGFRLLTGKYKIVSAVVLTLLISCASAPVQEMNDARQAINAAKSAYHTIFDPTMSYTPTFLIDPSLERAEKFLQQAERQLSLGNYQHAQFNAKAAKQQAIEAQKALAQRATP